MSREAILNRIALAEAHVQTARGEQQTIPTLQRAAQNETQRYETFCACLIGNGANVVRCNSGSDIPAQAAKLIADDETQPLSVRITSDPRLQRLDWGALSDTTHQAGAWKPGDTVAVSHALSAVSDTGTLVVASGVDNPTSLNFLSEHHIIVVATSDVVDNLSEVMHKLTELSTTRRGGLMRALNFISGASRTADIGGQLVHGAHGPRKLSVIVYDQK